MKAIQLEQPRSFRTIDIPDPSSPGIGEALVRVHRVGICGTDIGGYLGKMPFFSYPRIPGHELGVEILEIGEGVSHMAKGDHCAVEPYINCQNCSSCQRGYTNCCENHQTLGVHCDGGLRPVFLVPARKLHRSQRLNFDQLALVETLAIGCHAIHRGNPTPSESVLVIGAGPIGLSVVEFAKLSGANTIVMDINASRLNFCKRSLGIQHTILISADGPDLDRLRSCTKDGSLPEVVIDATGNNNSMSRALDYCGFAGRVVYVGITQQHLSFPHAPVMHRKELTLMASRNALSSDFSRIISLIEKGQINTDHWITHRTPFENLVEIFPSYTLPETGVIKAIVEIP